jgi:hypothetical protein
MTITHTAANPLGDVTYTGITVHLTQQAYSNNYGTDGDVRYYAKGVDDEGNEYMVTWETYDNAGEIENEDEMCDWDDYTIEAL